MGLRQKPLNINKNTWYYEETDGIHIIHEVRHDNGEHFRTEQIVIPWKRLLESVKRKYKNSKKEVKI